MEEEMEDEMEDRMVERRTEDAGTGDTAVVMREGGGRTCITTKNRNGKRPER
jgi:hypothetical protein